MAVGHRHIPFRRWTARLTQPNGGDHGILFWAHAVKLVQPARGGSLLKVVRTALDGERNQARTDRWYGICS